MAWTAYVDVFIRKLKSFFTPGWFVKQKYDAGLNTADFVNFLKNLPQPSVDVEAKPFFDEYKERVKALSTLAKDNDLIRDTREQFSKQLKDYAVTDEKRGELIVNFEVGVTAVMLSKIYDVALQVPQANATLRSVEVENMLKLADLPLKEAALMQKNKELEILEKELEVKQGEILLKAANLELQDANIALLNEQTNNEKHRKRDIQASVLVKNYQALSAWMSARFEHIRRKVLLKSDEGNLQINKAKEANSFLNTMASRVDPSATDITYVKTQIDSITNSVLTIVDDSDIAAGAAPTYVSLNP